jgi:hypothetical protein
LASLQVDPEAPSIWFAASGSQRLTASDRQSSWGSKPGAGAGAGAVADLAIDSPFYTAGGGSSQTGSAPGAAGKATLHQGLQHAAAVEQAVALATGGGWERALEQAAEDHAAAAAAAAAAASAPSPADVIPPADETAAAAVADVAAAAAAAAKAAHQSPADAASASAASVGSSRLDLRKQLTLKYPVVITPSGKPESLGVWPQVAQRQTTAALYTTLSSLPTACFWLPVAAEHVDDFRGPLRADALAEIYAGRHEKVPPSVLWEAIHFLKYSYAGGCASWGRQAGRVGEMACGGHAGE